MDFNPLSLIIYFVSFLIGSIPFGILISRLFQVKNLTQQGSGNIGATNVTRVLGFWPAGFLTFVLDMGKGLIASCIAGSFGTQFIIDFFGLRNEDPSFNLTLAWSASFFAVLGHCYSPWLFFRGGKGVATAFGAFLFLSPWAALAGALGFAYFFISQRTVSLASLAGLTIAVIVHLVIHPLGAHLWAGAGIAYMILLRHEANLDALLENREKSF